MWMWLLNHIISSKQSDKEEITRKIKDFVKNENKNTTYQNWWDAVKSVFRIKFIAVDT